MCCWGRATERGKGIVKKILFVVTASVGYTKEASCFGAYAVALVVGSTQMRLKRDGHKCEWHLDHGIYAIGNAIAGGEGMATAGPINIEAGIELLLAA